MSGAAYGSGPTTGSSGSISPSWRRWPMGGARGSRQSSSAPQTGWPIASATPWVPRRAGWLAGSRRAGLVLDRGRCSGGRSGLPGADAATAGGGDRGAHAGRYACRPRGRGAGAADRQAHRHSLHRPRTGCARPPEVQAQAGWPRRPGPRCRAGTVCPVCRPTAGSLRLLRHSDARARDRKRAPRRAGFRDPAALLADDLVQGAHGGSAPRCGRRPGRDAQPGGAAPRAGAARADR